VPGVFQRVGALCNRAGCRSPDVFEYIGARPCLSRRQLSWSMTIQACSGVSSASYERMVSRVYFSNLLKRFISIATSAGPVALFWISI